jgi:hypothetical protein
MEVYETTTDMSLSEAKVFEKWFNKEIGTESELNKLDDGAYLMFYDLTMREVQKIRDYENSKEYLHARG